MTAPEPESLPEPSFEILVMQLGAPALIQLGDVPNPMTGKTEISLERARYSIGMLELLSDLSRGNLDDTQTRYIEDFLARLRMRYAARAKEV